MCEAELSRLCLFFYYQGIAYLTNHMVVLVENDRTCYERKRVGGNI